MSGPPMNCCPTASQRHAWLSCVKPNTCSQVGRSFITDVEEHYRIFRCLVQRAVCTALIVRKRCHGMHGKDMCRNVPVWGLCSNGAKTWDVSLASLETRGCRGILPQRCR